MLAERLEVTKRSVYRDVANLIGSGVPIEGKAA
jgi:predicted DNA-binding transcriptional regulator YafY